MVKVGDQEVPFESLDVTDPATLHRLSEIVDRDVAVVDAEAMLASPIEVSTLPASAVMVSADGRRQCVFREDGTPTNVVTSAVQSVESGVVYAQASLVGVRVVANPSVVGTLQCP